MKSFTPARLDVAELTAFFRARAIERMRRKADTVAALRHRLDRDGAQRARWQSSNVPPTFWLLYAR